MEIFRFKIRPEAEIKKEQAIKEYNSCPHCHTHLAYSYQMDYLENRIEEESSCVDCHLFVKKESHPLQ